MITTRDSQIFDFLNEFKVANTTVIANLFFPSLSTCQKRLKILYDMKEIKRGRDNINNEYIYYIKRPKQLRHSLLVTKFYAYLKKKFEVVTFKIEPTLNDIRPDALFVYIENGKKYLGLLEVEISNKGYNHNKYEKFYSSKEYTTFFPVMPTIFLVSDKIKHLDTKLEYLFLSIDEIEKNSSNNKIH